MGLLVQRRGLHEGQQPRQAWERAGRLGRPAREQVASSGATSALVGRHWQARWHTSSCQRRIPLVYSHRHALRVSWSRTALLSGLGYYDITIRLGAISSQPLAGLMAFRTCILPEARSRSVVGTRCSSADLVVRFVFFCCLRLVQYCLWQAQRS